MSKFVEIMDQALQEEIKKAKSEGFKEAQNLYKEKTNKVLLAIAGELFDLQEKETNSEKIKERINEVIDYINQYRDYEELK